MAFGALLGLGVKAAGSLLSSKKQGRDAQGAQFDPANVSGTSGTATFGPDGALSLQSGGDTGRIQDAILGNARNLAEGGATEFGLQQRQTGMEGLPDAFQQFLAANQGRVTPEQALQAAGVFGDIRRGQSQFGQQGLNAGFGSPSAGGLTNFATGAAAGLLNPGAIPSFNELAGERLSSLRAAARPGEDRAVNAKFQSLFNKGALGSTGGANQIGALAQAQEQADLGRVINSQDFANSQQNQLRGFQLQGQGLGANLLGQAFGGIAQDQSRGLGLANIGANLFNQQGQTTAAQLGAFQTADAANLSRAGGRVNAFQDIFGFGNQALGSDLQLIGQGLGQSQSIEQTLLDQGRLGASIGQSQAVGGANAAALSPGSAFGGALQGIGTGLANSDFGDKSFGDIFGGIFGRK